MTDIDYADLTRRLRELHEAATAAPWADRPDPERTNDSPENWRYEDDTGTGSMTTGIRPFGASVEDTIAEFWGTEHDDAANAALTVFLRNHAEDLATAIDTLLLSLAEADAALLAIHHGATEDGDDAAIDAAIAAARARQEARKG